MNNIKTLTNYITNRKRCPKCFKNDLILYSSPGEYQKYEKNIYQKHIQTNVNYMSTIKMAFTRNRFYRARFVTIKNISSRNFDLVEIVCGNCYHEFMVFVSNSVQK